MGAASVLRKDCSASAVRQLAKASMDAALSRRLLALAEIYAGGRRTEAARVGATDRQVIRDWVLRFNADGPATGLPDLVGFLDDADGMILGLEEMDRTVLQQLKNIFITQLKK